MPRDLVHEAWMLVDDPCPVPSVLGHIPAANRGPISLYPHMRGSCVPSSSA